MTDLLSYVSHRTEKEPEEWPSGSSRLHHQHCVLTGQRAPLWYIQKHTSIVSCRCSFDIFVAKLSIFHKLRQTLCLIMSVLSITTNTRRKPNESLVQHMFICCLFILFSVQMMFGRKRRDCSMGRTEVSSSPQHVFPLILSLLASLANKTSH